MSAVFVDVDTGIDDALALIYLLASDAEVVGIASTGGNIAVDQVCANNLALLDLCRAAAIQVSRGADRPLAGQPPQRGNVHGLRGLGYAELPHSRRLLTDHDAATAWVRAARTHPGELVAVATAPLTNLALALRMEPDLPSLVRRLVIMGGVFDGQGPPEWNFHVDAAAAGEVFAAWTGQPRLPVVCGLDVTRKVVMTAEMLDDLPGGAPVIRFIIDAMRFYFEANRDRGLGYLAHLHDPLAAAVALDPQLVSTRPATVDVDVSGDAGMTRADWSGTRMPNAQIGVDVDPEAFFGRFTQRVKRLATRPS